MTRVFVSTLFLLISSASHSQVIDIPPEKAEILQKTLARLFFADQCDKRLDMPEIVVDAKKALTKNFIDANIDNAEEKTAKVMKSLSEKPQEKEETNFSLFNPKMCGQLAASLKQELAQ